MNNRGQALLLVIWAMFVMCFAILGLVRLLNINIGTASAMKRVAMTSSVAFAGTTMGRNVDFPPNGQVEKRKFPNGCELEVFVVSENSKLNINQLLATQDRDTLRSLFKLWKLNDVEADTVVDCLLDYVEPGSTRRLNGAKAEQYKRAGRKGPSGKPFRSIEEMASVLNFDLVSRHKENWREFFTIYGDGKLDLTTAPADLIKVVCRIGDSGVRAITQRQSGHELKDMDAARMAMGLTEKEFKELGNRVSVGGKVRRIRSTATLAQARRTIETICRMDANETVILEWKEW